MKSNRYLRHTTLKGFGDKAQVKLKQSKVLVVGGGGLGIPVLQYLNAMGVGTLGIVEGDTIDLTNLQRQVIYSEDEIGLEKASVLKKKLGLQNSETNLQVFSTYLRESNALEIIQNFDVVVDASDNFPTRYLINDACVILKKPFVYGALHGYEAQLSVFNYKNGPTYRCLYPQMPSASEIPDCNINGVLGVLPGIVGNLQALETVKLLTEIGEVLSGKLLLYNGLKQRIDHIIFEGIAQNKNISHLAKDYQFPKDLSTHSISANSFREAMVANDSLQIVDVRTEKEYRANHLENAKNIPLSDLQNYNDSFDRNKKLFLICKTGTRSNIGCEILTKKYQNLQVYSVEGGMNALEMDN